MPSSVPNAAAERSGKTTDAPVGSKRPDRGTLLSRISQRGFLRQSFAALRSKRSSFGVDRVTLTEFEAHLGTHIHILRERLRAGTFRFSPLRPVAIPKGNGKFRPILIPTVEDRVVQRAILRAIAPTIDPLVNFDHSFAFRKGRGVLHAVAALKKAVAAKGKWILVVDIEEFFPSVDASKLLSQLSTLLPDDSLSVLLARLFEWEIKDLAELPEVKQRCFPSSPGGLPQGSLLSPMMANLYLAPFDEKMRASGLVFLRYADDLAVVCDSREDAEAALTMMTGELSSMGLKLPTLGKKKCRLWEFDKQGVEYLGCYLQRSGQTIRVSPSQERVAGVRKTISDVCDAGRPDSLAVRYKKLSGLVRGWLAAYSQVCDVSGKRVELLDHAQSELTKLLKDRGLIQKAESLSTKLRAFLSMDELFSTVEPPSARKFKDSARKTARDGARPARDGKARHWATTNEKN